jgi:hypothetical protein
VWRMNGGNGFHSSGYRGAFLFGKMFVLDHYVRLNKEGNVFHQLKRGVVESTVIRHLLPQTAVDPLQIYNLRICFQPSTLLNRNGGKTALC